MHTHEYRIMDVYRYTQTYIYVCTHKYMHRDIDRNIPVSMSLHAKYETS